MDNLEKVSRKITLTLLAEQSLFSAAMILALTVASIIAVQLTDDNERWTGVPTALVVVGAALMAYPMGRFMDRNGRRLGLSIGNILGILSMLVAGGGVIQQSLPIFLLGVFGLGLTKGVIDQGRYAAAEASPLRWRARAISWVVLGGTFGAVLGPSLLKATTDLVDNNGLPPLSGPWLAGAVFFGLSLILIQLLLRPDPQLIGQRLSALEPAAADQQELAGRPYRQIIRDPNVKLATGALIFSQVAMIVVMVVTPVHMHNNSHALGAISIVIMAHTLGMFGLSFVTGWLADRLGRARIILFGGLTLSLACLMAPFSHTVAWLAIALFLLGLGWNFCFVSGSALLSDVLRAEERGRVQGLTDTMINISSGLGSLVSGLIFAAFGFALMSWLTILLGLIPVVSVILLRRSQRKVILGEAASC
jgi:MFS family permease